MKQFIIKILLMIILILYAFLNRFVIVIPFSVFLLFLFILEFKNIKRSDLTNNMYTKKIVWLIIISSLTLLWSPNIEDAKFQIMVLIMLANVSFLLYYFIKKYEYYNLILYSVLTISFVNHIAALKLSFFDFLMYNSSEVGGIDGVVNGWGWGGRFSGILDNPNALAILMMFSLFFSAYVLDGKQTLVKLTKPLKFICVTNIILSLYTIFMTQSRKGIIFGIMLLLVYMVLKLSLNRILPYLIGLFSLVLLLTFIPEITTRMGDGLGRIESVFNLSKNAGEVDNSATTRLYFITQGWEGFQNHPFMGHGINSFRHYYGFYAHNNFIELLFGVGIVGFLIYYSIHWSILRKLSKKWRENLFLISFVLILLSMDVGFVSYESKMSMLIYITLSLIIAHSNHKKEEYDSTKF